MRIVIVGGTGHIGTYLVPRLTSAGHEVAVVARHPKPRYADPRLGWEQVEWILADRTAEEADGSWAKRMRGIEADVVVDLICFTPEQNRVMIEAFEGRIEQFLHCGTIWAYGPPRRMPYRESDERRPITDYGRNKARIEADLIAAWRRRGFPATILHPGHISGRKWLPIDPQGTRNGVGVYEKLARGEVVHLPRPGLQPIHHVHADDLAQLFEAAMVRRQEAVGEAFSGVTEYASTLRGCCEFVARLFGREANIEYAEEAEMERVLGAEAWAITKDHVDHSPCCSIEKARRLLGYEPRYTTEQIYVEAIEELVESGKLVV